MNTYKGGECVLDAEAAAGIAGDWLVEPSIQGAAVRCVRASAFICSWVCALSGQPWPPRVLRVVLET